MTQRSFDPDTSREMVGDERAREIESKARVDADAGEGAYDPPNRYSPTATCAERGGVNVRTTSGTQCIRAEVLPSPNETP